MRKNDELNDPSEARDGPSETRFGLHVATPSSATSSSERMNYTALGATVNLAARLEGLNKNYGTRVLASAAVKAGAEHRFVFRSVDRISPKGFAEAVAIHELRCAREGDVAAELAFCSRWDEVYALIEHDDPAIALAAISAFLGEYPGTVLPDTTLNMFGRPSFRALKGCRHRSKEARAMNRRQLLTGAAGRRRRCFRTGDHADQDEDPARPSPCSRRRRADLTDLIAVVREAGHDFSARNSIPAPRFSRRWRRDVSTCCRPAASSPAI